MKKKHTQVRVIYWIIIVIGSGALGIYMTKTQWNTAVLALWLVVIFLGAMAVEMLWFRSLGKKVAALTPLLRTDPDRYIAGIEDRARRAGYSVICANSREQYAVEVALCEELSFVGVLNTFRAYGARLVGVRMEPDGMNIEDLEAKIKANPRAKLIYIIPNFQNPTGFTTSLEKRKAIYALARRYDLMILEDDPYGELRYEGDFLPPLKTMDTDGRVIFAGSFSKTMAPALRVGFVVAEKSLIKRLIVAKQTGDVHTATLTQEICYRYMAEHDFGGHLNDIRRLYAVKCKRMLDDMEQKFSPAVSFNRPQGGLFVTAFLPEGMDAWPFVQEGIARKVACVPGVAFVMDPKVPSNAFRMNFSMPSLEQIDQGTDILGKLTCEWCK